LIGQPTLLRITAPTPRPGARSADVCGKEILLIQASVFGLCKVTIVDCFMPSRVGARRRAPSQTLERSIHNPHKDQLMSETMTICQWVRRASLWPNRTTRQ